MVVEKGATEMLVVVLGVTSCADCVLVCEVSVNLQRVDRSVNPPNKGCSDHSKFGRAQSGP